MDDRSWGYDLALDGRLIFNGTNPHGIARGLRYGAYNREVGFDTVPLDIPDDINQWSNPSIDGTE